MTNTSRRRSRGSRPSSAVEAQRVGSTGAVAARPAESEPTGTHPGMTSSGRTLRWGVRVLLIEAAALAVLTLIVIWAALASSNVSLSSAIATPAFAAIYAAVLAGLGVALGRGKALARGPAIVLEMLMLPMGYYMIVAGLGWLGVPTMAFGLAGSVLLLAPATRAALGLR